ncbi:MAG: D-glycero-beta-D-manno-heptose 1,7-bisphosphate 7-phosphatase [Rhodoferax sp.]
MNRDPLRLVILDRDGTINEENPAFVDSPDAWRPLPGALDAIARLNHAGWHVVVASNQSGLGRGLYETSALNAIQAKMHKLLAAVGGRVDAVFYCPHGRDEGCHCRKPEPGLFEQIAERFGIELQGMPTVGDRLEDLQAGVALGCEPHLVLTGQGANFRGVPLPAEFPPGTRVHDDLAAFATYLIEKSTLPRPAAVQG